MDYEKKYKDALERAKKIHGEIVNNELIGFPGQIEDIFPELRESEDERIRKEIIECIETLLKVPGATPRLCDWIAWLEKQKEQKPADLPPGFYFIDLDGKKYYSKEFRFGDMKMKIVEDKSEKSEEWSEEEEINKYRAIFYARHYQRTEGETKGSEECINWLQSLRPSWKPSEEQMAALKECGGCKRAIESLYQDLKKLM